MKIKLLNFYQDLIQVSKLTKTKNKKIIIAILTFFLTSQIFLDIIIILSISSYFSDDIGFRNEIVIQIIEFKYLFPIAVFLRYIFTFLDVFITTKLRYKIETNLKEHLLNQYFKKGNLSTGDAYFYVNTIAEQVGGFYSTLATFFGSFIQIIIFSTYLVYSNIELFITFALGSVLILIPSFFITKYGRKNANLAYESGKKVSEKLEKVIENLFLIKILEMEKSEKIGFLKTLKKYYSARLKEINSGTINSILPVFLTLFVLSLILSILRSISILTIDFAGVLIRIFQSLGVFNKNVHVLSSFHVYLEKLKDFEYYNEIDYSKNYVISNNLDSSSIIKFENVGFRYFDSNVYTFENLNLNIKSNSHTVIIGPNGSGKSTILGLISGVHYPTQGKVTVFSNNFGYVSPNPLIINGTLRENILYGNNSNISNNEILKLISKFELFQEVSKKDLDKLISNKNLSSGQMQKIAFIRALIGNVDILILDESTSNLDKETKSKINSILKDLNITIVNSTHSKEDIDQYDDEIEIYYENNTKIVKQQNL